MRLPLALFLAAVCLAPIVRAQDAADDRPAVERGREALDAGIAWLLENQNEDGSWGYHAGKNPYQLYAPVPGAHRAFTSATTALALMALRRSPRDDDRIESARRRGLHWLLEHGRVKRSNPGEIYAVWAWSYALNALARYLAHPVEGVSEERLRTAAASHVRALEIHQCVDGGWGYFDFGVGAYHPAGSSMSFVTASALIALHEARDAGVEVPERVVRRAVGSLTRSRTPEGTYIYSFNWRYAPQGRINRPQGSLTRKPACDLALYLFDAGPGLEDLDDGVKNLLEKRAFARMALHRPVPHESWFAVSGYFHLFGVMNAAECFARLPEEAQAMYRDGLIEEALVTRSPDGSFWDYPMYGYHKPYGTAYATLALLRLVEGQEKSR